MKKSKNFNGLISFFNVRIAPVMYAFTLILNASFGEDKIFYPIKISQSMLKLYKIHNILLNGCIDLSTKLPENYFIQCPMVIHTASSQS